MVAEERLLAAINFMFLEGMRVEEAWRYLCRLRLLQDRTVDTLDLLELLEAKVRLEYFNELQPHFDRLFFGS